MGTNKEHKYYNRQIVLDEVGIEGQKKLTDSNVLVIGAGGLGAPVLSYLVRSGVGNITIYDHDLIDETNLHRQVLFGPEDIGYNKALIAAKKLKKSNPYINIEHRETKFDEDVDISLFDIIIDCSDNFKTKYLAHDMAYKSKKVFSVASIHKFEGQVQLFDFNNFRDDSPCLRCLWNERPNDDCVETCEEAGVLGAVAGVIGSIQAMEIIKFILGLNCLENHQNLIVNLLDFSSMKIKITKDIHCPQCSKSHEKELRLDSDSAFEIDLKSALKNNYKIISLNSELQSNLIDVHSSNKNLMQDIVGYGVDIKLAIACRNGRSSLQLVKQLREIGINDILSISDSQKLLN